MYKRVTLLEKKPSVTMEEFSEYWEVEHGPIAAAFTGLERYHQNHRLVQATPRPERPWPVEGIVELWFNDEAGTNPGRDHDVTARLIVDEPTIFRSLTGFPVPDCDISSAPMKVWVLGSWADGICRPEGLRSVAGILEELRSELRLLQAHAIEPGEPAFLREALQPYPQPPRAIAIYQWLDGEPTLEACEEIEALMGVTATGVLGQVQVVPTREVIIA